MRHSPQYPSIPENQPVTVESLPNNSYFRLNDSPIIYEEHPHMRDMGKRNLELIYQKKGTGHEGFVIAQNMGNKSVEISLSPDTPVYQVDTASVMSFIDERSWNRFGGKDY